MNFNIIKIFYRFSNHKYVLLSCIFGLVDNSYTNFSTMWKTLHAASSHSGRYTCVLSGYDNLLDPVFASVYITVINPGKIGSNILKTKSRNHNNYFVFVEEFYKLYRIYFTK